MEIHNSKLVYTSLAAKSKEDLECQVGGHNSPSLRSIIIYIYIYIYIYTIYIYIQYIYTIYIYIFCIYIQYIYIYNIYIYTYTLNSRRRLCSAISPVRMKQLQAFVYYYFLF